MRYDLNINGQTRSVDVEPDMPLLWVLRETLDITSPKFGCGVGVCGACTIHIDGQAARACTTPVGTLGTAAVTTLEGLGTPEAPHSVQSAWIEHQVPQCGYCQPGMIMAAAALLAANPRPDEASVAEAMQNICRCGTYPRVKRAIAALATGAAA
jgi:isoquinoline 1-oxidoreductase subunit alpha